MRRKVPVKYIQRKMEQRFYVLSIYILKLGKKGAAEVVSVLKAKRKGWLMFLEAKQQQEMFIGRLFSLKTIR